MQITKQIEYYQYHLKYIKIHKSMSRDNFLKKSLFILEILYT
ncbi:hypothetical protein [Acinetobacter bereziniae]|nr:hypothetical protein [Acinetobacter bereziniae]